MNIDGFLLGPLLAWAGAALVIAGGGGTWWPWWAAILLAILTTVLAYVAWRGHRG